MAAVTMKKSSFSRTPSSTSSFSPNNTPPGIKRGLNNTTFISSGISDLDNILGGGFQLGSLVMVMEDPEAPHHLLLLRNFMSQGLVHDQHLLYASPFKDPRAFLGTLPNPISPKDNKKVSRSVDPDQEKGLRIAWQYMKYFGENHQNADNHKDTKKEYCNEFDLRKPLDRQFLSAQRTHCISIQESPSLAAFCDQCSSFLAQVPRKDGGIGSVGRIAIQSLCAPQCGYSNMEWDMLSLIRSLKSMLRSSNAVAVITFPSSLLSPSSSKRWQHLADTLLSVRAVPDEDKDMAKLLTGYQDMVGFLHVHKVSQINTQVPVILEAHTFSMKLERRKTLVLERLNQAPVDGSSGTSYNTSSACSSACSSSSKAAAIDF